MKNWLKLSRWQMFKLYPSIRVPVRNKLNNNFLLSWRIPIGFVRLRCVSCHLFQFPFLLQYGRTCYQLSDGGIQNWKDFWPIINILKGYHCTLWIDIPSVESSLRHSLDRRKNKLIMTKCRISKFICQQFDFVLDFQKKLGFFESVLLNFDLLSCSRHRTTKFTNSESPIFTTKFLFWFF